MWEYDSQGGDTAERMAVDKARAMFTQNRFEQRHSSDLLMRLQVCIDRTLFFFFFTNSLYLSVWLVGSVYLLGLSRESILRRARRMRGMSIALEVISFL